MDSKFSTASVNISLNSGSERKLTQLIVEDDRQSGSHAQIPYLQQCKVKSRNQGT